MTDHDTTDHIASPSRRLWLTGAGLGAAAVLAACAGRGRTAADTSPGWKYLVRNGAGLEAFRRYGQADWAQVDGTLQAQQGGPDPAYLVTTDSYANFELKAEFWVSEDANSGVFLRCQQPEQIGETNGYEVNIFDQRPDQSYATGSIVRVATVPDPKPRAGGRWNTLEVSADGPRLVVTLNGRRTVDATDNRFIEGPIALQWGRGTVRFRNVMVRRLPS